MSANDQFDPSTAVPLNPSVNKQAKDEFDPTTAVPLNADNALVRGYKTMTHSVGIGKELAAGNADEAAQRVKEAEEYRRANPGSKEGQELYKAWEDGDGILGGIKGVAGEIKKDWDEAGNWVGGLRNTGANLKAMGEGLVAQVPNMLLPMAGMAGGAAAGAAAGSAVPLIGNVAGGVAGAWAGGTAGNAAVESGHMFMDRLNKAGIDPSDTAAVAKFAREQGDAALGDAVIKGGIISGVDVATAGLGSKILRAPVNAAADRALAKLGVDMADDAAVKAARESDAFKDLVANDSQRIAAMTGASNVARNVGVAALDPAGEFTGEFVGTGVATGEWDTKNAALEAISSMGQSGVMYAGQKAYQALTNPLRGRGATNEGVPEGNEPSDGTPSAPLLLTHNPDPLIAFTDGSVGTRSQMEAYIESLPESERLAARARMLGYGQEKVVAEPEPVLSLGYDPDPLFVFPDGTTGRRAEVEAYISGLSESERMAARARMLGYAPQQAEATPQDLLKAMGEYQRKPVADHLAEVQEAIRAGTNFTTPELVKQTYDLMEDAWLEQNVRGEASPAAKVAAADAAGQYLGSLLASNRKADARQVDEQAIALTDARVRSGRVIAGMQNALDSGSSGVMEVVNHLGKALEIIKEPPLSMDETRRVVKMVNAYNAFAGTAAPAPLPDAGRGSGAVVPDVFADNRAMETLIPERKPSQLLDVDPSRGALSKATAMAVDNTPGALEMNNPLLAQQVQAEAAATQATAAPAMPTSGDLQAAADSPFNIFGANKNGPQAPQAQQGAAQQPTQAAQQPAQQSPAAAAGLTPEAAQQATAQGEAINPLLAQSQPQVAQTPGATPEFDPQTDYAEQKTPSSTLDIAPGKTPGATPFETPDAGQTPAAATKGEQPAQAPQGSDSLDSYVPEIEREVKAVRQSLEKQLARAEKKFGADSPEANELASRLDAISPFRAIDSLDNAYAGNAEAIEAIRVAGAAKVADKLAARASGAPVAPSAAAPMAPAVDGSQQSQTDAKREKALKRVNSEKGAFFFSQPKAQAFIADNGLSDTHTLQKQDKAFKVVAKPTPDAIRTSALDLMDSASDDADRALKMERVATQSNDGALLDDVLNRLPDVGELESYQGNWGRVAYAVSKNPSASEAAKARAEEIYRTATRGIDSAQPAASAPAQAAPAAESTAPEHAAVGVDDRELAEIVEEFSDAHDTMVQDGERIHHLFDAPEKSEVVRLQDKVKVYTAKNGWMTPAQAKAEIAKWKAHAKAQGKTNENANKVVLSLFDLTGKWSQPWEDAGYQVFRFDIQADPEMGDVNNFSTEFFSDWFGDFDGQDIYAILAACPCTDFASSGARHFAAKDADGRTVASVKLVHQTLATIEYFKPAVWAVENPVGRIEKLGGLPPWRLSFDPNHIGDPYTKKTLLWGRFNGDMPIAPVEPTEGSKMHSQYGGKSLATKNARSATPEGFAYGFFMANNAADHPVMALANKFDRLDRGLIEQAIKAGVKPDAITSAVEDHYYIDLNDDAANAAIRDLIRKASESDQSGATKTHQNAQEAAIDLRGVKPGDVLINEHGELHRVNGPSEKKRDHVSVTRNENMLSEQRILMPQDVFDRLLAEDKAYREESANQPKGIFAKVAEGKKTRETAVTSKPDGNSESAKARRDKRVASLRSAAYEKNPFMAFLGANGINLEVVNEFAPGQTERRKAMVPGYGPIFRREGKNIDELAVVAKEDGFIVSEDADEVYGLIARALRGERIAPMYADGDVAKNLYEARMAAEYDDFLEQQQAAPSNDVLGALTPEELDETGYNDYDADTQAEIRALIEQANAMGVDADSIMEQVFYDHSNADPETYNRAAKAALQTALQASDGRGSQDSQQASSEEGEFSLSAQTPEELRAKAESEERARADKEKRDRDAEQKAQADAQVNDFVLTGSDRPADVGAAYGQNGLFDGASSTPAQSEDAEQGANLLENELSKAKARLQRLKREKGEDSIQAKAADARVRKLRQGIFEAEDLLAAAKSGDAAAIDQIEALGFGLTAQELRDSIETTKQASKPLIKAAADSGKLEVVVVGDKKPAAQPQVAPGTRVNTDADRKAADRLELLLNDIHVDTKRPMVQSARTHIKSVIEELRKPQTVVSVQAMLETAAQRLNATHSPQADVLYEIAEQLGKSQDKAIDIATVAGVRAKWDGMSQAERLDVIARAGIDEALAGKSYDRIHAFGQGRIANTLQALAKGEKANAAPFTSQAISDFLSGKRDDAPSTEEVKAEMAKPAQEQKADAPTDRFANNTLFTADKVAAARARMKAKLGQLNSGIDPEMLVDGMTIAGAYIESGVRNFTQYAKLMIEDLGDGVKPYLLSFWEGARNYPSLDTSDMTDVAESKRQFEALVTPESAKEAAPEVMGETPKITKRSKPKVGAPSERTLQQDWGVEHIDGYGNSERETGNDTKDAFLKDAKAYLKATADVLDAMGFEAHPARKGRPGKPISVNEGGMAVSGDISLTMRHPESGVNVYVHVGDAALKGVVPMTPSGIAVMARVSRVEGDILGTKGGRNLWLPTDMTAAALAEYLVKQAMSVPSSTNANATPAKAEAKAPQEKTDAGTVPGGKLPAVDQAQAQADAALGDGNSQSLDDGVAQAGRGADSRGSADAGADRAGGSGTQRVQRTEQPASGAARDRANVRTEQRPASDVTDPATAETSDKPALDADFTIDESEIGKGGLTKKYKDNIAAIRILKAMDAEGRKATPDERKAIAKYVGWGGLKGVFDKDNKQWSAQYAELKELLTDAEYKAARASILNAHYTSPDVVKGIFSAVEKLGFESGRVLEPSVGVGNFFGLMPANMRKKSSLHGVELDALTSKIVAALYPNAKIAQATGFQNYDVPSGYFDLAIGNPPFGNEPIVDDARSPYSGHSIHNYFFAKSIDKLRPGGLLAMVVSHNFLDARNSRTRAWIAEQANLVSAVRLPNTAFLQNAGTSVVTDIVVFQKKSESERINGLGDSSWVEVGTQELADDKTGQPTTHYVSNYFLKNPSQVLGTPSATGSMYGPGEYTVEPSGKLTDQIAQWTESLEPVFRPIVRTHEKEAADVEIPAGVKVGSFFIGADGAIMVRGNDVMGNRQASGWVAPNGMAAKRMAGMIGLRDALREQMRLERSPEATEAQIEANRASLSRQYNDFQKKFGFLNDPTNRRLFLDDTEAPLLLALEFDYDKGVSKAVAERDGIEERAPSATKADILSRRVMFPPADHINVSSAKDAMVASLNYKGTLDLPYMASLYGDKPVDEIVSELGDLVFNDPLKGFVTSDEYLSGDVKTKLAEAEAAAQANPTMKRNVDALKAVIPADKKPSEIHVTLGASFVPKEILEAFGKEVTGATIEASYIKATGQWVVVTDGAVDATLNTSKWGTSNVPATEILLKTLLGQGVVVTKTIKNADGSTQTIVLEAETEAAREKQAAMKAEWQRWLWADAERADHISRIYNEKMNRIVPRKFDGSHMTFPGMSPAMKLLQHQKNAVWRSLQSRQVLLDHVVGAGKTFEVVATIMEMRRLGMARKPFIAVPNHLTLQWRSEFSRLYPAANVLAATPDDFSKGNREKFFSKIITGDWDAVIVGHSSLKKIGLPQETEQSILQEQIDEISAAIEEAKRAKGHRNIIRDMENIRARLDGRMKERMQSIGERDKVVTFDELGVDAFAIDELHEFKNLTYNSTMERVPGMGNPQGSDKSFDLFVKIQWMNNTYGDQALLIGATGTPVSNSLVEMFNMQRFMQYPTLKRNDLHVFDAWARQFGSVESLYEVSPSGTGFRQSNRFAKFKNLPALMANYQTFADTVTLDDLKAQEEAQGKRFPVPKIAGGRPQNIVAERSPQVAKFMGMPELVLDANGVIQFGFNATNERFLIQPSQGEKQSFNALRVAKNASGEDVFYSVGKAPTVEEAEVMLVQAAMTPQITVDEKSILGQFANLRQLTKATKGKINALSLTNLANKAGLDYRLIDPAAPDFPGSKINQAVDRIVEVHRKWSADKGTQLVFCDMSVPLSAGSSFASKERRVYLRDDSGAVMHTRGTLHTLSGFGDAPIIVVKKKTKDGTTYEVHDAISGRKMLWGKASKAQAIEAADTILKDDAKRAKWEASREEFGPLEQSSIDDYINEVELETEGVEVISTEDILGLSGPSGFSVYDDIKAKLIAKGIPEHEIAFIHDYDSPTAKDKLFRAVNMGGIRVLLGSTPKMGAGTNVQKRLVALHHIDAPWRPSDLEQREGRIVRRGNELFERDPENFEVDIFRYATSQTYDTRRWQIIEHKARGIEQLRNYDGTINEIDDIEGEAANASDMKAAASGDPLILEETQLRNEVRRLESLQMAHVDEQAYLTRKAKIEKDDAEIYLPQSLATVERLLATASENPVPPKQFVGVQVGDGKKINDREAAVKAISIEIAVAMATQSYRTRFVYRGIGFSLWNEGGFAIHLESPTGSLETFGVIQEPPSAAGMLTRFANYIDRLEGRKQSVQAKIEEAHRNAAAMRAEIGKPFEHADALKEAREAHKRVQRRLLAKGPDVPPAQKARLNRALKRQQEALIEQGLGDALDRFTGGADANADEVSTNPRMTGGPEGLISDFVFDGAAFARGNAGARTGTRTDRAVMDMVTDGQDARTILSLIADTSSNPFYKQVAKLLLKTGVNPVTAFGEVADSKGKAHAGKYSRNTDSLTLGEKARGIAEQVFMHEMIHAATLMSLDRKGLASLQMRSLFEQVKKAAPESLLKQYGMKNVGEFVAEAFTNPEFQAALRNVKVSASKNRLVTAWDSLVSAIRSALGLPVDSTNALSRVLQQGAAVMSEEKSMRARGMQHRGAVRTSPLANGDAFSDSPLARLTASAGRTTGEANRAAVQRVADAIAKKWKNAPRIVVASSISDAVVPEVIRNADAEQRAGGAEGSPEGVMYRGTVYLFADMLGHPRDTTRVLFHEALGHFGLRGVFGKDLGKVLDQVVLMRRKEVLAKAREYGLDGSSRAGQRVAAEEVLANMAEATPELHFVRRAIAAIRTWLRENVPALGWLQMSDDEIINNFILPARRFVQRGGNPNPTGPKGGMPSSPVYSRDEMGRFTSPGDQTQTEAFKNWFGDSKVVDADGKPLVVYHGSTEDISEFDTRGDGDEVGSFFTTNPDSLNDYTDGEGGNITPVYLNIENPYEVSVEQWNDGAGLSPREAKRAGYDGFVIRGQDGGDTYIAFHSEQIKSSIGNNGEFDPGNADIRFSRAKPEPEPEASNQDDGPDVEHEQTQAEMDLEVAKHEAKLAKARIRRLKNRVAQLRDELRTAKAEAKAALNAAEREAEKELRDAQREAVTASAKVDRLEKRLNEWREKAKAARAQAKRATSEADRLKSQAARQAKAEADALAREMAEKEAQRQAAEEAKAARKAARKEAGDAKRAAAKAKNARDAKTIEALKAMDAKHAGKNLGDALKKMAPGRVKESAAARAVDWLKHGLQFLGRRQLTEIYSDRIPQLKEYDRIAAQMEADKNDAGAAADETARAWGKLKDERALAELMHDATLGGIDADPKVAYVKGDDQAKSAMLKARFAKLSPEAQATYRKVRDEYKAHHEAVQKAIEERIARSKHISSERRQMLLKKLRNSSMSKVKGVYFPLARYGQYVVAIRDAAGEVVSVSRAETMEEAKTLRAQMVQDFHGKNGQTVSSIKLDADFAADRDMVGSGFLGELYEVMGKHLEGAQKAALEDAVGQLYLQSLPDLSWRKHGIHRKGTPGFSQDARRAYAQHVFSGARSLAKLKYGDQLQTLLSNMKEHIDSKIETPGYSQPAMQRVLNEMNLRHEAMMNPKTSALSSALTSAGFLFYLGLSPAAAAVNLTQTPLVALPIMGAKWGFGKASSALMSASTEVARNGNDLLKSLDAKVKAAKDPKAKKAAQDERDAVDAAIRAGVIDVTMAHDLAGIAQGEDSKVMWKIRPVMRIASVMFHHAEKFNRQATFLAAYRLAKAAHKGDHAKAYADAVKATYDGHFDFSASNRPRIMQGNVARVVLLFKQFSQNMIYTLARNMHQALLGKSPAVKAEARKVLAALIATHALAAGVLGLPLVGTLLAIASALGSDEDEPWDAEAAIRNLLAETLGPKASEVIARGVSRLTPFDISGRVGLDNLLLPDVQEGLGGQRWAESFMTGALGPMGGIVIGASKGAQTMLGGDFLRGLEESLPVFTRNPLKAWRYANEGVEDKTGVDIQDEVSGVGVFSQLIGFSPSEVRLAYEGKNAIMNEDAALGARRSQLLKQFARAIMDEDYDGAQEVREAIYRFNEINPKLVITQNNMWQGVRSRTRRIEQAENGVYLPRNRRDALEAGAFARSADDDE